MRDRRCSIMEKIDSFISHPDAGMLTGERRMGTEHLLDLLADRIAEDDSANVILVKEMIDIPGISSKTVPGKIDHILIYFDTEGTFDTIVQRFSDACVYGAKELCHQLPVCFRGSAVGHIYRCSCE
jgi:hypothetical protein